MSAGSLRNYASFGFSSASSCILLIISYEMFVFLAGEMYEGTTRMLLEYGATVHEHMSRLRESGSKLSLTILI